MDPVKKIEALEAKRAELKKALAVPERYGGEWHDIRHNIDSTTSEITMWGAHLPKVEDGRWVNNPYVQFVGFAGAGMATSGWWVVYPRYCLWRHDKYPYTASQVKFRQYYFDPKFPDPVKMSAHRLPRQLFQGFLAMSVVERIVMWARKRPPPPPK